MQSYQRIVAKLPESFCYFSLLSEIYFKLLGVIYEKFCDCTKTGWYAESFHR